MLDDSIFATDPTESLSLWRAEGKPPQQAPELRVIDFEFSNRGDRVPGHIWLPAEGEGPFPTILLQHGITGSKDADYIQFAARPWARRGAAVVSIDFPLHGKRYNPKLQELFGFGIGFGGAPTPAARELVHQGISQAVSDLHRTVDAMSAFSELDRDRLAYASFSLGSIIGATFVALEPRISAAALALGGGGFGGPQLDPALRVARVAPRPLLFVNMRGDRTVVPAATETLYSAAGEPKEIHWFDGDHRELPGRGFKLMWQFLAQHLGIAVQGG